MTIEIGHKKKDNLLICYAIKQNRWENFETKNKRKKKRTRKRNNRWN